MVRVGIVDYKGFKGVGKTIYETLVEKGYDVGFAKNLSELESPQGFDVILCIPESASKSMPYFWASHPKIRTAIVTASEEEYFLKDEIPVISYSGKKIIAFIEGKSLEGI